MKISVTGVSFFLTDFIVKDYKEQLAIYLLDTVFDSSNDIQGETFTHTHPHSQ
jgi:hypothetical protein